MATEQQERVHACPPALDHALSLAAIKYCYQVNEQPCRQATSQMTFNGEEHTLKKGMVVWYMRVAQEAPHALQWPGSSMTSSGAVNLAITASASAPCKRAKAACAAAAPTGWAP